MVIDWDRRTKLDGTIMIKINGWASLHGSLMDFIMWIGAQKVPKALTQTFNYLTLHAMDVLLYTVRIINRSTSPCMLKER